jgi:tripeptide aminopeptidase
MRDAITQTLIDLAGLPSASGEETAVREYIRSWAERHGLPHQVDAVGNLIVRVPAMPAERDGEPPVLLNAHMDRVPPGRAHTPVLRDERLYSDGTTNLGADDSAGIAIILHSVATLAERALPHPPLLLLFTVGEEIGLVGAKAFDPAPWGCREGIVFDNAGEPGAVVTRAASYIAFDVMLHGKTGHPGKSLAGTASAIEMFRLAVLPTHGVRSHTPKDRRPQDRRPQGDITRVSIGRVEGGTARNAVPAELRAWGEARTLLEGADREALLERIERAFVEAATELGGSAEVTFDPHAEGYTVSPEEPLLRAWTDVLAARGQPLTTITTFIGSDASALRRRARVFTVSTGAMNEHTPDEWIALAPLADLVETAVAGLSTHAEA